MHATRVIHHVEAFVTPSISSTHALMPQTLTVPPPSSVSAAGNLFFQASIINRSHATKLKTKKEKEEQKNDLQDPFYIDEPRLLAVDLLAMLVTTQLLTLTEIMYEPSFWESGGFNQAISFSSFSSIGFFVRRDCLLSICWICSGVYNRGYDYAAFVNDLASVKSSLKIFLDFSSLLITAKLISAGLARLPVDGVEILREAWLVIIVLAAFRFAYSRANRF
jgi:hypothetical protein